MFLQIKHIARIAILAGGVVIAASLHSCKAQKCDCPNFGGHHLNHNSWILLSRYWQMSIRALIYWKPKLLKPLSELKTGEKAFIVDLLNPRLNEKLISMGIFPGVRVEVRRRARNSNCMVVRINNQEYNIYLRAAATIITNTVSLEFELN